MLSIYKSSSHSSSSSGTISSLTCFAVEVEATRASSLPREYRGGGFFCFAILLGPRWAKGGAEGTIPVLPPMFTRRYVMLSKLTTGREAVCASGCKGCSSNRNNFPVKLMNPCADGSSKTGSGHLGPFSRRPRTEIGLSSSHPSISCRRDTTKLNSSLKTEVTMPEATIRAGIMQAAMGSAASTGTGLYWRLRRRGQFIRLKAMKRRTSIRSPIRRMSSSGMQGLEPFIS